MFSARIQFLDMNVTVRMSSPVREVLLPPSSLACHLRLARVTYPVPVVRAMDAVQDSVGNCVKAVSELPA